MNKSTIPTTETKESTPAKREKTPTARGTAKGERGDRRGGFRGVRGRGGNAPRSGYSNEDGISSHKSILIE